MCEIQQRRGEHDPRVRNSHVSMLERHASGQEQHYHTMAIKEHAMSKEPILLLRNRIKAGMNVAAPAAIT